MTASTISAPVPAAGTGPAGNAELLAAAGHGDERAWSEIHERYRRLVSSVVRSFRLQEADARDAEQRTWLKLVEHRATLRDPQRLGGWLATTASRECLRILRDTRSVVLFEMDAVADQERGVEQHVVDADTVDRIWGIVSGLPPRSQTIMEALFAGDVRPYAEVSRAIGVPIGSLGPTRARLIEQVRRRFDGCPLAS